MLPAKLYAVLAMIFAACAGIAWRNLPGVDIGLHDRFFVVGPMLVLLFCAVSSINFAVLYYAADRFFHACWNRTLSILHLSLFVCFGFSLAFVFAMSTRVASDPGVGEAVRWLVVPFFAGILSLVACFVLFGVNLTMVVVQILRARFASH